MRRFGPVIIAMLLAACGSGEDDSARAPANESQASPAARREAPAGPGEAAVVPAWDLQPSGEGVALALLPASGPATLRLFCPAGQNRLLVNVPAFRPIASEERLSFGSGGEVVALVADPGGDRQRGGVSGAGEVPDTLERLVGGPLSASYGAQRSGPHPAPPPALARPFAAACDEGAAAVREAASRGTASASPCRVQGSEPLRLTPLRAVGTEPFWAARIEGRCVTYSHPEDQQGTRVWTRYTPGRDGGIWSGALGGRRFELRTRAHPGCSDGMSDKHYPLAVELIVAGERRTGCAEPP
jgi:uncharacterized membrane protein